MHANTMGSYHRFPKFSPAAELARRRDEAWREEEFRHALRALPRPAERIDTSKAVRLSIDRLEIAELLLGSRHPTRH
jgi:hypothetical protein